MIDKQAKLDQIKADILSKNICPDLAKQAKQLVMGDGNSDADIVFIGEAPGKKEDELGIPFVGAAGKFLNEMLGTINLKREDIYITNIVKYRPPNNRDPLLEEKAAFLPYLEEQLEVIRPKIVVTLGRHSLNCFLPDLQIGKVHGQPIRFHWSTRRPEGQHADALQGGDEKQTEPYLGTVKGASQSPTQQGTAKLDSTSGFARSQGELVLVLLPLFHPAAALYNGRLRQTLLDDFARIPEILKKIN